MWKPSWCIALVLTAQMILAAMVFSEKTTDCERKDSYDEIP
jgi:hypothetical protein